MEPFLTRGASFLFLGKIFLSLLPVFLIITIPVSMLITAMVTFSRFTADGELIALKSAGISLYRILRPLFIFSFITMALTYLISFNTTPWSGTSFKDMALNLLKANATVGLEEGTFNDLSNKLMIYVDHIESDTQLNVIFISDLRKSQEPILIIAKEGLLVSSPTPNLIAFRLTQGTIHHKDKNPKSYERIKFATYDLNFELDPSLDSPSRKQPSLKEIKKMLAESNGEDVQALRYLQEYHRNFSLPFACLVFGLLGAPLGIGFKKSGRLGGFFIGVFVVILYYSIGVFGDILVASKFIPPWFGAWLPNILATIIAPFVIWKFSKRIG
jgi:lipopolysaccharide export system permease protein